MKDTKGKIATETKERMKVLEKQYLIEKKTIISQKTNYIIQFLYELSK